MRLICVVGMMFGVLFIGAVVIMVMSDLLDTIFDLITQHLKRKKHK